MKEKLKSIFKVTKNLEMNNTNKLYKHDLQTLLLKERFKFYATVAISVYAATFLYNTINGEISKNEMKYAKMKAYDSTPLVAFFYDDYSDEIKDTAERLKKLEKELFSLQKEYPINAKFSYSLSDFIKEHKMTTDELKKIYKHMYEFYTAYNTAVDIKKLQSLTINNKELSIKKIISKLKSVRYKNRAKFEKVSVPVLVALRKKIDTELDDEMLLKVFLEMNQQWRIAKIFNIQSSNFTLSQKIDIDEALQDLYKKSNLIQTTQKFDKLRLYRVKTLVKGIEQKYNEVKKEKHKEYEAKKAEAMKKVDEIEAKQKDLKEEIKKLQELLMLYRDTNVKNIKANAEKIKKIVEEL